MDVFGSAGFFLIPVLLASNIDFLQANLNSFNTLQAGKLLLDLAATSTDTQTLS